MKLFQEISNFFSELLLGLSLSYCKSDQNKNIINNFDGQQNIRPSPVTDLNHLPRLNKHKMIQNDKSLLTMPPASYSLVTISNSGCPAPINSNQRSNRRLTSGGLVSVLPPLPKQGSVSRVSQLKSSCYINSDLRLKSGGLVSFISPLPKQDSVSRVSQLKRS